MKLAMPAVLAVLAACSTRDAPPPAPATTTAAVERPDQVIGGTIVPQIHDFPAGHAADIRRIFDGSALSYPISVISDKGVQTQFVNPKPVFVSERRFVVGLPPAAHAALDKLIAGLTPGPTPLGATYEITFWAVEASSAAQPDVPPDLAEIAPALDKLAGIGKRRFRSIDRVGGRSRDGAQTKLVGRLLKVEHRPTAGPDGIELEVTLQLQEEKATPTVDTTLHLPIDQALVIGDSAQAAAVDGNASLLLYVVRAHRVE